MLDSLYIFLHTYIPISFGAAAGCEQSLLGMPTWYKYLKTDPPGSPNYCAPVLSGINDFWLIGLAAIEILLRIAALVAIFFIIYAGVKYSSSRANPDKVNSAKYTLQDALVGLVIAIASIAVVSFIGGRLTQ